jgi:hypothetical protein
MPAPQTPLESSVPLWSSPHAWAAVAAGLLVLLIVFGALPRLLW